VSIVLLQVLVLTPTRELAIQVKEDFASLSAEVRVGCVYGGEKYERQGKPVQMIFIQCLSDNRHSSTIWKFFIQDFLFCFKKTHFIWNYEAKIKNTLQEASLHD